MFSFQDLKLESDNQISSRKRSLKEFSLLEKDILVSAYCTKNSFGDNEVLEGAFNGLKLGNEVVSMISTLNVLSSFYKELGMRGHDDVDPNLVSKILQEYPKIDPEEMQSEISRLVSFLALLDPINLMSYLIQEQGHTYSLSDDNICLGSDVLFPLKELINQFDQFISFKEGSFSPKMKTICKIASSHVHMRDWSNTKLTWFNEHLNMFFGFRKDAITNKKKAGDSFKITYHAAMTFPLSSTTTEGEVYFMGRRLLTQSDEFIHAHGLYIKLHNFFFADLLGVGSNSSEANPKEIELNSFPFIFKNLIENLRRKRKHPFFNSFIGIKFPIEEEDQLVVEIKKYYDNYHETSTAEDDVDCIRFLLKTVKFFELIMEMIDISNIERITQDNVHTLDKSFLNVVSKVSEFSNIKFSAKTLWDVLFPKKPWEGVNEQLEKHSVQKENILFIGKANSIRAKFGDVHILDVTPHLTNKLVNTDKVLPLSAEVINDLAKIEIDKISGFQGVALIIDKFTITEPSLFIEKLFASYNDKRNFVFAHVNRLNDISSYYESNKGIETNLNQIEFNSSMIACLSNKSFDEQRKENLRISTFLSKIDFVNSMISNLLFYFKRTSPDGKEVAKSMFLTRIRSVCDKISLLNAVGDTFTEMDLEESYFSLMEKRNKQYLEDRLKGFENNNNNNNNNNNKQGLDEISEPIKISEPLPDSMETSEVVFATKEEVFQTFGNIKYQTLKKEDKGDPTRLVRVQNSSYPDGYYDTPYDKILEFEKRSHAGIQVLCKIGYYPYSEGNQIRFKENKKRK